MATNDDDPRNAAAMRALRAALEQASREARGAQGQLQDATARFNAVSQQVIGVVGGSAQGIDKQLVQTLEEAIHHTEAAVAALGSAASSSRTAI